MASAQINDFSIRSNAARTSVEIENVFHVSILDNEKYAEKCDEVYERK